MRLLDIDPHAFLQAYIKLNARPCVETRVSRTGHLDALGALAKAKTGDPYASLHALGLRTEGELHFCLGFDQGYRYQTLQEPGPYYEHGHAVGIYIRQNFVTNARNEDETQPDKPHKRFAHERSPAPTPPIHKVVHR